TALFAIYVPRDSSSYRAAGRWSALSQILAGSRNGLHWAGLVWTSLGMGRGLISVVHALVISSSVIITSKPWSPGWAGRLKCILPNTAVRYPAFWNCLARVGLSG